MSVSASDPQQRQAGRELTIGLSARDTDTARGERGQERHGEATGEGEEEEEPLVVGGNGVVLPSAIALVLARPRDPKGATRDIGQAKETTTDGSKGGVMSAYE